MNRTPVSIVGPVVAACLLLLWCSPADAQPVPERNFRAGMLNGIGYTAVPPDVVAGGVGGWRFFGERGIGVFLDGKMTTSRLSRRSEYCPEALGECTLEWVEFNRPADSPLRNEREWVILNGGGMYALTPEFAVMLGAGAARLHRIWEFVDDAAFPDDPRDPITERGNYFVDHAAGPEWKLQGVIGLLLRAGPRLAFRFGYESGPGGLSVGAYLVLP